MNDDIVSYASDIGFQNFLINTIEDKNLFSEYIFKDMGNMYMLQERLAAFSGVSEVVYDGTTSSISFLLDYPQFAEYAGSDVLNKPHCDNVSDLVSFTIQGMLVNFNDLTNPTELGKALIEAKCRLKNLAYADGYRWLLDYVGNPQYIKCFFKTLITVEPKYIMLGDTIQETVCRNIVKF